MWYGISKRAHNWRVREHSDLSLREREVIPQLDKEVEEEVKINKGWKDITISMPVDFFKIIDDRDLKIEFPIMNDLVQRMKIIITWYNSERGDYEECVYEKGMDYPADD